MFGKFTKFPLWKNDGKSVVKINSFQKENIDVYNKKVEEFIYNFVENPCLCGKSSIGDTVISEKDRYGIKCDIVLCENCGVIRLKERLDEKSTEEFYKNEYRAIYVGQELASEEFFQHQKNRGAVFLELVQSHLEINNIKTVFEVGCGAGGILSPFYDSGMSVSGCDFGEKYLSFGKNKGFDLYQGEIDSKKTPKNSQDLVILSHVMEHLNDPLKVMPQIIEHIREGKYLLVEVPGIFDIKKTYFNPILYFQNAHVYNYYYYYLEVFFKKLGLDVIYGDERCTFLLKKPIGWVKQDVNFIDHPSLVHWKIKVKEEIKKQALIHFLKLNPYYCKRGIVSILDFFNIKDVVKKMIKIK